MADYLANIDHAPDPTVKKEAFSGEISVMYGTLIQSWVHSKEPKVFIIPLFSLSKYPFIEIPKSS